MPIQWEDGSTSAPTTATTGFFGVGGAMGKKAMASAGAEAKAMLDSAKGGGFKISEQGAQGLRDALRRAQERLSDLAIHEYMLGEQPQLGTHDYGKRVAVHDLESASGKNGALNAITAFRQVLADADEALKIAVKNYQQTEQDAASTFNTGI